MEVKRDMKKAISFLLVVSMLTAGASALAADVTPEVVMPRTPSSHSDDSGIMPLDTKPALDYTTFTGTRYEYTLDCTSKYPWYKVWIRNNGDHAMKVTIGDDVTNQTLAAGASKEYYGKTSALSREVEIVITGSKSYPMDGEISARIGDSRNAFD